VTERAYVLGTDDEELERLGQQHRLWSVLAFETWERAGIRGGSRVLEIGCGPGFTTVDLAGLTTRTGRVLAFDLSPRFVARLRTVAAALGLTQIEARQADVQKLPDLGETFDAAYVRWVLCFLPDPEAVIAAVARSLRPGGTFGIQEFIDYEAMNLAPASPAFRRGLSAVAESFRHFGGDSTIGLRLPGMLLRHGFRIESLRPVQRTARPHEPLWQWPTEFFGQQLPRLVEAGFLTAAELAAWRADWAAHSADPAAFFVTPAMLEIVAQRV